MDNVEHLDKNDSLSPEVSDKVHKALSGLKLFSNPVFDEPDSLVVTEEGVDPVETVEYHLYEQVYALLQENPVAFFYLNHAIKKYQEPMYGTKAPRVTDEMIAAVNKRTLCTEEGYVYPLVTEFFKQYVKGKGLRVYLEEPEPFYPEEKVSQEDE